MAITAEARTEIITLVVGMFGAAPGSNILDQLVVAEQSGASLKQIAASVATSAEFVSIYPLHLTNADFATQFVNNIVGNEVPAADKAAAAADLTAMLNAGASRSDVMVDAINLLNSVPEDNPVWGPGAARLHNQAEVAEYFSVTLNQSGSSLQQLQNVVASVTSDDASVDAAIAALGGSNNPGDIFDLTTGQNTFTGFAGDDTFNAYPVNDNGGATTFSAFDKLDGGAGNDTLNIFTDAGAGYNDSAPAGVSVKNIETVNIYNENGAATLGDASLFQGVKALWQYGDADTVTNLKAETVAGFNGTAIGLNVEATATATSATVALKDVEEGDYLDVWGDSLNTVNVSGNLVDNTGAASTQQLDLYVEVGKDVQTAYLNTDLDTYLNNIENAGSSTKDLLVIDASASTGGIEYWNADTEVQTIKTGSGDDIVYIQTDTAAATKTAPAINALVETGTGNDEVYVDTFGTGATSVSTGAGDDIVEVYGRSDGTLTIALGDGNDTLVAGAVIGKGDVIDGGAGTDTLLLSLVGVANIGAFSNFEVFDAIDLGHALDIDILSSKNTVTEIITTGDVGVGASLINLGAGVGYRIIGDNTGALGNALALTQKVAGALSVTLDIDETGTKASTTSANETAASVVADNAKSLDITFDSDFVGAATGAGDNEALLQLVGSAATGLNVVSGGENASNILNYQDNSKAGSLTTVTITGSSDISLNTTTTTKLATVDASGLTGGLSVDLTQLADGANVILGSGTDLITVTNTSTLGGIESITGFEKTAAISVSVAPADATAAAAAIAAADQIILVGATIANANAGVTTGTIANGVLTFTDSGPSTLDLAIGIADLAADAVGETVVFEYLGDSYVFSQGATDTIVKLAGVTDVANLVENGVSDQFFIV